MRIPVCMSEPFDTFPDMHSMPAATAMTAISLLAVSFSLKTIGLRIIAIRMSVGLSLRIMV